MHIIINYLFQWFQNNQTLVWFMSAVSVIVFLAFLIGGLVLIVKLPADYFQRPSSVLHRSDGFSISRIIYIIFKNIIGFMLLLSGIIMLFLPGQGLLSMVVGLSMLDLPGKTRIIRRIISEKHVLKSLNRLRARFNCPPLEISMTKNLKKS